MRAVMVHAMEITAWAELDVRLDGRGGVIQMGHVHCHKLH